jgi:hypothetical protein
MANRISKGTTRVAMLGVFLMFLGAPLLANTNDRCHQSLNGISGYKMLKARAKTMGNVTGHESISENVCENKVLVDAAIQSMVTIYIYIYKTKLEYNLLLLFKSFSFFNSMFLNRFLLVCLCQCVFVFY